MKKIDITYVFGTGRKSKLLDSTFSNEFFYGYDLFHNEGLKVEILSSSLIKVPSSITFLITILKKSTP